MPNFIEIEETFCGRTDVRTYVRAYVRTDGRTDRRTFETGIIRSTLSKSRPKNKKMNFDAPASTWILEHKKTLNNNSATARTADLDVVKA